jgi:hypothetical protein
MTRTYRTEFPDYPEADMPTLPDGFEDDSWHNEACPRFLHVGVGVCVWTDYADPALSEFPEERDGGGMMRFNLQVMDSGDAPDEWLVPDGRDVHGDDSWVAESDTFADILLALPRLAAWFSDKADTALTAANACAGTPEGDALMAKHDRLTARAEKAAEVFGDGEADARIRAGRRLADILREWLKPHELAACVAGEADPPDFCDDNEATAEAFALTFGASMCDWWPMGGAVERLTSSRANAATRVASRLLITPDLSDDDLAATAAASDPVGLTHTLTRMEAR